MAAVDLMGRSGKRVAWQAVLRRYQTAPRRTLSHNCVWCHVEPPPFSANGADIRQPWVCSSCMWLGRPHGDRRMIGCVA